jgi:hypothetical protein
MTYTVPAGTYGDYSTAFIQAYIDQKIADVVGLAPATLDTLGELADALGDDPAYFSTIAAQVTELNTDVSDIVTALGVVENDQDFGAFTAATLTDTTNLKAVLEAFASAYETTKGNLESADTGLSNRLDVLETDPTTAAAVAAVQSDVDQNELDSDAADNALSGRLDTLEVDPTTQSAVDAKLNIANPAATGDLTVDTEARLEFDGNITKLHNDLRGTRIDIGNNITVYPAAAGGRFEIEGGLYIRLSDLEEHNNDAAAAAAGIVVGGVYYDSSGHLKIRRT